jgi:AraC family transcriptional regulator
MKPKTVKISEELPVLSLYCQGHYRTAPREAWSALTAFAESRDLIRPGTRYFGLGHSATEEEISYAACITVPDDFVDDKTLALERLPAGRFVCFSHTGSYEGLEPLLREIEERWLPESGEEVDDRPWFCEYLNPHLMESAPDDLITEIYVPIV